MKKILAIISLSLILFSCGGGHKTGSALITPQISLKKLDKKDGSIEFVISNFNEYKQKTSFPLLVTIFNTNDDFISQVEVNKKEDFLLVKNPQNNNFYIIITSSKGNKSRKSNILSYNGISCNLTQTYISSTRTKMDLSNVNFKILINNIIEKKKENNIFNLYLSVKTPSRIRYFQGESLVGYRTPYISGLTGYDINRLDKKIINMHFSKDSDEGKHIFSSFIEDGNTKEIIAKKDIEIYFKNSTIANRNLNLRNKILKSSANVSDSELKDLAVSLDSIFKTAGKAFDFMSNFNEGAEAIIYYKELKLNSEYNAQRREHLFNVFVLNKILENSILYSNLKLDYLVENVIKLMENHLNEISSVGSFGAGQEQILQFSHEEFSLFSVSERILDVHIRAVLYFPSGEFPQTRYYPQRAKFEKEFSILSTSNKKVLFPYPGIYDVYAKDIDGAIRKKRIIVRRIGQKIDVSFNYDDPVDTRYKKVFGEKNVVGCGASMSGGEGTGGGESI